MRGRPDVDLRIPPVVHPGEEVEIELVAHSGADTPIHFVELTFHGDEIFTLLVNKGPNTVRHRPIVHSVMRLRDEGTLAEGTHRFAVKIKVPDDAPGSYLGTRITIRYELRLHVAIPWWPDLKEAYELLVEPRATARPKPKPETRSSAGGSEPFIELSLVDTAFSLDDEVSGAFAVGNVGRQSERAVELSLAGVEHAKDGDAIRRAALPRHIVPGDFHASADGGEVAFRFRIPAGVVPSFSSPWCEVTWVVQALLRTGLNRVATCTIPVTIGRFTQPREGGRNRPQIGAARWRRVWSDVGDRHGLVLAGDRLALVGSRGDVQIRVATDQGDDDVALVAVLRYPSLGLDLRIVTQLLIVMPNPLEALFASCKVDCREREQGKGFLGPELVRCLRAFKDISVDDTRAVVRAPAAGFDEPSISAFVDRTAALAEALVDALANVPPPAAMADAAPAWRAFAGGTGARFSPGGMALAAASIDGGSFDVTTLFGARGEVTGTRVALQIDPPLDYRVDLHDLSTFAAAPPGARDFATALQRSVRELGIEPDRVTVELDGPVSDPSDLHGKMIEMLVLARRLRGERTPGPYR